MRTGHVHQQQQPGPTQQFDHHDSTDTAMVRWLQSAGLQHLASSNAFPAMDPRLLQNLLMEDHSRVGIHYAEDKRKIFGSAKSTSTGSIPGIEPLTPPTYMSGSQDVASGLSSPEFRGEFGCGIIDLHSIEDTELLSEVCQQFHLHLFLMFSMGDHAFLDVSLIAIATIQLLTWLCNAIRKYPIYIMEVYLHLLSCS
ncbi:hypothetical protein KP509_35G010400 [Ceratopteris richardii]|uniref:SAM domain-containing protein n=1 Tax=Ceratopteris richardii TaxID=49495 RepID=A0A8T2QF51_CERRI|nr:hypothetical protein KP509_35G010400 [Ceratopteris richardii]